ncbi:electron transport complex subunit RsxB [mine drainage metagenome]|uniref:Electron transport complex subunit RsxB n=1 Tax=mine drainage metagenome TaxID=410659 RepID=A0A1J5Q3L8_9ZZZZ
MSPAELIERIDAALPQTQCTRCGYADCRSYAEAVAADGEAINRCPPGGASGVARLAALTGRAPQPLDAQCGVEAPLRLAHIDERGCIGCTLCLQACPVDAIAGARRRMHSVVADWCTGCELCVAPCPTDCIEMLPATSPATGWDAWSAEQAAAARARHARRQARLERVQQRRDQRLRELAPQAPGSSALLAAALERARQRQAAR